MPTHSSIPPFRYSTRFAKTAVGRLPLPIDASEFLAVGSDHSPEGVEDLQLLPTLLGAMAELLLAEGLRWRTQETWFNEKAKIEAQESKARPEQDPRFAAKGGD